VNTVSINSCGKSNALAAYLNNERSKVLQNVVDILRRPDARRAHCLDQIGASQQCNSALLPSIGCLHTIQHAVDLVLKVVQHLGSLQVFSMESLPRINRDPAALSDRRRAHVDSVLRLDQARLLVRVADTGEVRADDLKVGIETRVVGGHFEHAQVQEGDWREGAASNEDQRRALGVFDSAPEAACWEFVLIHGHIAADVVGHCGGWLRFGVER
jgi:hypothetical protein